MGGREVESGTAATLTCEMTGLTPADALTVTWLTGDGEQIVASGITFDPPNDSKGKCWSDNVRIEPRKSPFHSPFSRRSVVCYVDLKGQRLPLTPLGLCPRPRGVCSRGSRSALPSPSQPFPMKCTRHERLDHEKQWLLQHPIKFECFRSGERSR